MRARGGWKRIAIGGAAIVLAIGTAACSSAGSKKSTAASSGPSNGPVAAPQARGASDAASAAGAAGASAGAAGAAPAPAPPGGVPPAGPRIVRTGTMAVRVARDGLTKAFDSVAAIATANGGFVADSSTTTADHDQSARLVLRVPVANFDAATAAIGRLGTVDQKELKGQDVTGQLVDLDARIQSFRAEENALRTLVGQAKAVGEVLQVQDQLFQVRQQIEQLSAQQASLDDQATYASIEVRLTELPVAAARPGNDRPGLLLRAVRLARDNSVAVARAVLLSLGWIFPLLVVLVAARLAWPLLRRLRPSS